MAYDPLASAVTFRPAFGPSRISNSALATPRPVSLPVIVPFNMNVVCVGGAVDVVVEVVVGTVVVAAIVVVVVVTGDGLLLEHAATPAARRSIKTRCFMVIT